MSKTTAKRIVNSVLSPIGLEVQRHGRLAEWQQIANQLEQQIDWLIRQGNYAKELWFKQLPMKTVIDVGANTGWFSKQVRKLRPDLMIYAFEPLPDCFSELVAAFVGDSLFRAFNLGLGESTGQLVFEKNEFSPSSSFLRMAQAHKDAFPTTANTRQVTVQIDRLDEAVTDLVLDLPLLLKLDVQGFEDRVLCGGETTARLADIILIETSFVELYEQQPLFDDIHALLKSWGFSYQGSFDQLRDPRTGAVLQEDSVFVNTSRDYAR